VIMHNVLRMRLVNRLMIVEAGKHRPEIAESGVERPIFIVGLNRTGTTLLHRTLSSASPELRGPRLWEMLRTVAEPYARSSLADAFGWTQGTAAERIEEVRDFEEFLHALAEGALRELHPIEAGMVEEDLWMLQHDCFPWSFGFYLHDGLGLPADMSRAPQHYAWLKLFLQTLQCLPPGGEAAPDGGQRWLCKMPYHGLALEQLFATFPDATVVVTHRAPAQVVPSMCALLERSRSRLALDTDARGIRDAATDALAQIARGIAAFRERAPPKIAARFIDVEYDALASKPFEEMAKVARALGVSLDTGDVGTTPLLNAGSGCKRRWAVSKNAALSDLFAVDDAAVERAIPRW